MINRTPQVVSLPTDLHKDFVQVPPPLRRLSHSFRAMFPDLVGEVSTETVHPVTYRLMADVDAAFVEQVLDVSK